MTYSVRLADLLSVFAIENGGEQTVSGLHVDDYLPIPNSQKS